ncbi:hypothetical protein PVW46_17325 [Mameliella sp. AT18]|uniref:hypothetical protein n=1 Tax=Mameliella sp. AT18 TaxID=3028385 RepID=UPI001112CB0F|nr:hypothetical protein [Mameliella sp. AT18]MDD9731668.1 hypothetical protein [Mameliella sp. AT18]
MPEDNVQVHRLVWSPDDFEDGKLLTSAFRRKDLEGGETNYVSVSRMDKLNVAAELALATKQAEKSDGKQLIREEAFSVKFLCGEVRAVIDDAGTQPFDITSEPLPENLAHCGVRNITDKKSRGYINQLRVLLVNLASSRRSLSELIAQHKK